jgi:integrase
MASVRKRTWTIDSGEKRSAFFVDFVDANGQRDRRQFRLRRDADSFRVEVEGQLRTGTFRAGAAKVTVSEVAASYLENCRARQDRGEQMTRHHVASVDALIQNHVLHAERGVATTTLAQLTASRVFALRDRLRSAAVSVATTRKALGALARILDHAIGKDLIAVNAARGVEVIGRRDEGSKKITPPSKAAFASLMKKADEDFSMVLLFAGATGVRAGELWALRWQHIEMEKEEVTIETRVDRYGTEDVTKTKAGVRTIPIGSAVIVALKGWRLRSAFCRPNDLVFPDQSGGYRDHDGMVKRVYAPLCKAAEVTGINWHSLRHFAVSCWIEAGFSPKAIQTFAGHTSLEVTMSRYGHLFPSEDHKVIMDRIAAGLVS